MEGKIKTTGDLRKFLCRSIEDVANGQMDEAKARGIIKLSAQVTENIYAEAKIAALNLSMNKAAAEIGKLNMD